MTSRSEILEDEQTVTLPPVVVLNPRKLIEPENVPASCLIVERRKREKPGPLVYYPPIDPPEPVPKYPLAITWSPEQLCFWMEEKLVDRKIWIWNSSDHSIYLHCCGLWDDTARLGASWCCYPRTRIFLPPGLKTEISIRATPRSSSPVPFAISGLQLATAYLRDHVTCFFVVPIQVKFLNYTLPNLGEGE